MTLVHLLKTVILAPLRYILDHDTVETLGVLSLRSERIREVIKYCRGRVLDVGCGEGNLLIKDYEYGIGIDVFQWSEIDVLCDSKNLPFRRDSFDSSTFVASLNHIPAREQVLHEVYRVLRPGGYLIITMINPFVGWLRHKLAWWDKDQNLRGMTTGELYGMRDKDVMLLMKQSGFTPVIHERFELGLNNIFIAER
ncbi:MAG: class I SAM-dependent methyltransferase [Desulfobacteraceae bacterium]|nr:class I SAM-dependent methyltransferase [Desulfobacteraceae bacterium]